MKTMVLTDEDKINDVNKKLNILIELISSINIKSEDNVHELFTVKTGAVYLNMSEYFIRKKIEDKELRIIRVGSRSIRIEKKELDKLKNK